MNKSDHSLMNLLLPAVLLVSVWPTAASGDEPSKSGLSKSVIYRTVETRKLRLDIDLPAGWKASDKRPAIVCWSGGGFRNGGTSQFEVQARYLADRGIVAFRAEYRDLTRDKESMYV